MPPTNWPWGEMYKTGYEWPDWVVPAATQGSKGRGSGSIIIIIQCSKLRVHPALCVHKLDAECTYFGTDAPGGCTLF